MTARTMLRAAIEELVDDLRQKEAMKNMATRSMCEVGCSAELSVLLVRDGASTVLTCITKA